MPITSLLELDIRPDAVDEAKKTLAEGLVATRAFDGNLGVDVVIDVENPAHWILVEKWESLEHDNAYRKFRASPEGSLGSFGTTLAGAPKLTRFETTDV